MEAQVRAGSDVRSAARRVVQSGLVVKETSDQVCIPVMKRNSEIQKIAFVGDYLPRKCGIATFTYDLCTSVATQYPGSDCFVVPINDISSGYDYPAEVRFEIEEQEVDSYLRAADFLNFANADVVCLQHEFGIYGGPAGSHVVRLLRDRDANCHHAPYSARRSHQRTASDIDPDRRLVGPADRDVGARSLIFAGRVRRAGSKD